MSTETKTVVRSEPRLGVKAIVKIGMLAAVAVILMLFEIPLPFAPSFYEIDFSEVPVLVGCFAMGPFAGALIDAGLIYRRNRTRKNALIGMAVGTATMTVLGCLINAFVLLPTYAAAFGMPIDALVGMGTAVNSHITNLATFVMFAVAPFNLLKGVLVSVIVFLIYKKISPIFRMH